MTHALAYRIESGDLDHDPCVICGADTSEPCNAFAHELEVEDAWYDQLTTTLDAEGDDR
jgi:hypothetical protein